MHSGLFNAEHLESEGEGLFVRQNSKMMKVELNQGSVQALAGSMVAYQGDGNFEYQGSKDITSWVKKKVTGEDMPLMRVSGLFNTTLTGTGQVAIVTDGTPVVLEPAQAPTSVDPDAAVC